MLSKQYIAQGWGFIGLESLEMKQQLEISFSSRTTNSDSNWFHCNILLQILHERIKFTLRFPRFADPQWFWKCIHLWVFSSKVRNDYLQILNHTQARFHIFKFDVLFVR